MRSLKVDFFFLYRTNARSFISGDLQSEATRGFSASCSKNASDGYPINFLERRFAFLLEKKDTYFMYHYEKEYFSLVTSTVATYIRRVRQR